MLDHQRDLQADFRAFYHLSPHEALALPGPEYLALAYRAPAYGGAMTARIQREQPAPSGGASSAGAVTPVDILLGHRPPAMDSDGLPLADLFD